MEGFSLAELRVDLRGSGATGSWEDIPSDLGGGRQQFARWCEHIMTISLGGVSLASTLRPEDQERD